MDRKLDFVVGYGINGGWDRQRDAERGGRRHDVYSFVECIDLGVEINCVVDIVDNLPDDLYILSQHEKEEYLSQSLPRLYAFYTPGMLVVYLRNTRLPNPLLPVDRETRL